MWFVRLLSSVASLGKGEDGLLSSGEEGTKKEHTSARANTDESSGAPRKRNFYRAVCLPRVCVVCVCLCHTSGQFALISLPVGCKYYGSMMMAACCFRLMDHRAESTSGDAHEKIWAGVFGFVLIDYQPLLR